MFDRLETACAGAVVSEPALKQVGDGKTLLSFSIAVGGDGSKGAQFVKVAVWGERAEDLAPVISKGGRVYVEGALSLNEWEGHAGQKRFGLNLSAWRCEPLGQIGRNRPVASARASLAPASSIYVTATASYAPFDDAIPF